MVLILSMLPYWWHLIYEIIIFSIECYVFSFSNSNIEYIHSILCLGRFTLRLVNPNVHLRINYYKWPPKGTLGFSSKPAPKCRRGRIFLSIIHLGRDHRIFQNANDRVLVQFAKAILAIGVELAKLLVFMKIFLLRFLDGLLVNPMLLSQILVSWCHNF